MLFWSGSRWLQENDWARPGSWRVPAYKAVVFDMDGTLLDVPYDWLEIRRRLDVHEPSIIDTLNGLPAQEAEEKWRLLRSIEAQATAGARLAEGALEVLTLVRERGLGTALVTNNSQENTESLLTRFALVLDVVITRDSGFWKPSGAPVTEALRRLGVEGRHALAVGDSRYDVQAAAEAGCGAVFLVGNGAPDLREGVDHRFQDLIALRAHLERLI
jgi:HAD superfamily hydrolase (TIGR01509 family)